MPNWRTMIDKLYLGAYDLVGRDGAPKDFTLKIASVKSDLLKTKETPKGKRKIVIRFERAEKGFVCNSTNATTIEGMFGADTDGWIGKSITLYQGETRDPKTGGTVKAIRVRPRAPKGPAEAIEAQPVDDAMRAAQAAAFEPNPDEDGR